MQILQTQRGGGIAHHIQKQHIVDVMLGDEVGKAAAEVAVVDDIDIFIGVYKEGNKGISVGFLHHDDGGAVCDGWIVDLREGIIAGDKAIVFGACGGVPCVGLLVDDLIIHNIARPFGDRDGICALGDEGLHIVGVILHGGGLLGFGIEGA